MAVLKVLAVLGLATLTTANINITSPIITNWGAWGNFERCPFGAYAKGFQLRTEPNQFLGDDTALNAIRLFCGDPYRPDTAVVTSTVGEFGDWGRIYTCPNNGFLSGFQLRSESDRGSGDNTAANNIRFYCDTDPNNYVQGDGMSWGDWTDSQRCYGGQSICAIQTQVEPYQRDGDDTMLNNVRMECCDTSKQAIQASNDYTKKYGTYPQAVSPEFAALLRKAVADELNGETNPEDKTGEFNVAKLIMGKGENKERKQLTRIDQLVKKISETLQKEEFEKSQNAKVV